MIDFIGIQFFLAMLTYVMGFTPISEETKYIISGVLSLLSVLYTGYFISMVRRSS